MNKIILCLLLIAIAFVGVCAVAASDVDDVIVPIDDHSSPDITDVPTIVIPGGDGPGVEPTGEIEIIPLSILEGFSDNGLVI